MRSFETIAEKRSQKENVAFLQIHASDAKSIIFAFTKLSRVQLIDHLNLEYRIVQIICG